MVFNFLFFIQVYILHERQKINLLTLIITQIGQINLSPQYWCRMMKIHFMESREWDSMCWVMGKGIECMYVFKLLLYFKY